MPETIRFHLDENVSHAIALGLRRRGVDVTTTSEVELIGTSDNEQVAFALSTGRVIVTQDRDFLRLHSAGVNHGGITYCAKGNRSIGEMIQGLFLIWRILDPKDMHNQVEFL